jgi:chaperone required for assembly of F1-ATPase
VHRACRYEAGPLERRQRLLFDPLLDWVQQELGWKLHTSDSIFGTTQADATVAAVQQYLEGELMGA